VSRCLLLGNGPSLARLLERRPEFLVPTIGMNRSTDCDTYCFMWQGRYWRKLLEGEVTAERVFTLQRRAHVVWMLEQNESLRRYQFHAVPKLPTDKYPDGQLAPTGNLDDGTPCTMTGQFAIEVALHLGHRELYLVGYDLGYSEGHFDGDNDVADHALRDRQRRIMGRVAAQVAERYWDAVVWNIGEGASMGAFPIAPERVCDVARL
jgi:hypothetical protein